MKNITHRNWTILAAIGFGLGGEALLWLFIGGAPDQGLLMSLPVIIAFALTGALAWWYLLRRDFVFSVWRGIAIGLIVGLIALPVFWLFVTIFYNLVGKDLPFFDRRISILETIQLLPKATLLAWEILGVASAAISAIVSGILAYIKTRSLREPVARSWFERILNTLGILLVIFGSILLVLGLIPVSTGGLQSQPNPVSDYETALTELENIQANDLAEDIVEVCKTQWLTHGYKTEKVVVFFHGLSNCPAQFEPLAEEFYEQGYNVIIARFPAHVDISRSPRYMTPTAEDFRPMADMAIDLAHGLGDDVYVLGLSAGGGVAAWIAQYRDDVERVVLVAPFFSLVGLPNVLNQWVINLTTRLPNISISSTSPVPYQYLGMSTMGIGESMRFAQSPRDDSLTKPSGTISIILVTVENDLVVSNRVAQRVLAQWEANGAQVDEFIFDAELGLPHDVIDIHQKKANPDLVYPVMIDLIEGRVPQIP